MKKITPYRWLCLLLCLGGAFACQPTTEAEADWPEITRQQKPWTRWWWMGNAVDRPGLRANLIDLAQAGIGGVEITPIYSVKGMPGKILPYLSAEWLDRLQYTLDIADSLDMGVDMTLGTGWPYGGPQVAPIHAASKIEVQSYEVPRGEPFSQTLQSQDAKEPNLVRVSAVVAVDAAGNVQDLTATLPEGQPFPLFQRDAQDKAYRLYVIFCGKTGQKVKRAAPGGSGYTLDHYSAEALAQYVKPFEQAFSRLSSPPRAIFNDSYEVYGTDYTQDFLQEFAARRGYDLTTVLPLLLRQEEDPLANRVKSDYRETIADLLLHNFAENWNEWSHKQGAITKYQAHGSPGNLIDLYAAADIPECETFGSMPFAIPGLRRDSSDIRPGDADPVMLRFAASAAHIAGHPLCSSETFTWLRDHFKTALSQTKPEAEELLLAGINHIFLHGTTYSPPEAAWPGWKFYASTQFHPNNNLWADAPALFSYVARCQSWLQLGQPDQELLLYWPIFDLWDEYQNAALSMPLKIHSLDDWLKGRPFYETARSLLDQGYGTDFLSDGFLDQAEVRQGEIVLPGGSYKALVVPDCQKMPLKTLRKLIALQQAGAQVVFQGLPESVPGYLNFQQREDTLKELLATAKLTVSTEVSTRLAELNLQPEPAVAQGLKLIRRNLPEGKVYFLVNHSAETLEGYIPLNAVAKTVLIFDPLTGNKGKAQIRVEGGGTAVKLRIRAGESYLLRTYDQPVAAALWPYTLPAGEPLSLTGPWELTFAQGGPALPPPLQLDSLQSWTNFGAAAEAFSGTARYRIRFPQPEQAADSWALELGDVRESARVWLNGEFLGTCWSLPFRLDLGVLAIGTNELEIAVSNLSANRIRALERSGQEWKIFQDINIVDMNYKPFDATVWEPMPSGLLGPVRLIPLRHDPQKQD